MTGRRLFILGNSFSKPIPLNPFPFLYIPQFSRFTLLVYLTLSHQAQLAANRAQFYQDIPAGPFYGYNRPGAQPSEGIVRNWWRQGMMGGAKAHYDGIVAFSQTDFSDDLKRIDIPVLVMHGDDDQIVPYENSGVLSAKLLRNGTLKTYPGFPHGMPTTQAEVINADLLAFIRG